MNREEKLTGGAGGGWGAGQQENKIESISGKGMGGSRRARGRLKTSSAKDRYVANGKTARGARTRTRRPKKKTTSTDARRAKISRTNNQGREGPQQQGVKLRRGINISSLAHLGKIAREEKPTLDAHSEKGKSEGWSKRKKSERIAELSAHDIGPHKDAGGRDVHTREIGLSKGLHTLK